MEQLVQVVGALAVLVAFVLAQFECLPTQSRRYLALNLAGSAVLAIDAYHGHQWGFLILESVWALLSGGKLLFARPLAGHA
jgi:membrane-bound ClpP family serine protease